MRNFEQWLTFVGERKVPPNVGEEWLKELWVSYINAEWRNAQGGNVKAKKSVAMQEFDRMWNATPGTPNAAFDSKRVRMAIRTLSALTVGWVRTFKTQNEPTTDDGTLCIYHSFGHVQNTDALVLCQAWKAPRIVANLTYDDDRCVVMMALKYGFTKWCPLKGHEIIHLYKTPGTELIISVYGEVSTMPVTYWTSGTWHKKFHDIKGSADLNQIMATVGTSGHAIYGKVAERGEPEFWDNEHNGAKKTTQVSPAAKERRCIVFSKPPH